MDPEHVGERHRGENPGRHPKRSDPTDPPLERPARHHRREGQGERVRHRRAAGGREAEERREIQRIDGGLAVDQRLAAVDALQDQPLRLATPLLHEAVVVGPGVADVEVPGQALSF